ncbi:hypothetical protein RO21_07625 [[Actinobacillus] muris]|uniref:Uncharacterized protein n=1 Tax=Muribacter muris TaxID=67855 RepID=A0A0J5S323_9PAST|nr:hypothetical protein [Muribacter muris]KMK51207.1 hypothetical protein RO21_07625 [[Actinobacillus] muris] [Muribacter muris]
MCNLSLRKLAVLAISLGVSISVFASDWEYASLKDEENINGNWKKCHYETYSGFRFTINTTEYSCPYSLEVNVELGKWRKR